MAKEWKSVSSTPAGQEMQNLENVLRLYQAVLKNYTKYSDQLFEAVAKILNKNYKESPAELYTWDEDAQLPF